MAFDELKKDLIEANTDIRSYLGNSEEYYKLKVFKATMRGVTTFTHVLIIGGIVLLALLFLSLGAAYAIGSLMDEFYYGLLIVGLFYVIVAILCYIFREKMDAPILRKFSKYYFDRI